MKSIAIIPARSGSKGLPDKNIKPLAGVPLIGHSIRAAMDSGLFEEIMVSTDSPRYGEIARECGASVPFLRSAETSSDKAGSWDAVREVLENYRKMGRRFDMLTLLQPTSPLRTGEDILDAYRVFEDKRADSVVSVCPMDHSPLWANTLPEDGSMKGFIRKRGGGRQALPTYYRINGAIYMVRLDYDHLDFDLYDHECFACIMPAERSVDIDTELDFEMAEFLMSKNLLKK